jgi:hypothetical protein
MVPVAQKVQPMAQPTWDETHSVARVPCRITTASTRSPSCKRTRSLVVDLADRCASSGARRTLPATRTMQPPLLKQKNNKANQLPNIATQSEMILRNGKEMSERSR